MTNYAHIELNMVEIEDSTLMAECYERLNGDPDLFADFCQHFKDEIQKFMHDDGWGDVLK